MKRWPRLDDACTWSASLGTSSHREPRLSSCRRALGRAPHLLAAAWLTAGALAMAQPTALSGAPASVPSAAPPGRDPTALPAPLQQALAAAAAASAASGAGETGERAIRHVVLTGGRAYVVQRGRRYAVGESLDGARIERITEQAVWLREGGQVRREPLYGGVEKRLPPAAPAPPRNTKEKQP